ncbi:MAG: hypothetical protein MPN21_15275 [Thermoanaerobaculia bacterium]|nr:hypothetical protein [Thermoanaerobaculia bacterium]
MRSELRRLGYLDHSVERYLLQDALRSERTASTIWHLTAKVGGLIGVPVALLTTLVLAATNGHLEGSPFDLLPLFLHLLLPVVAGLGLGFLALSGLLVALIRFRHVRRIEAVSFGLAMMTALVGVGFALWQGYAFLPVMPRWQVVALLLAVPFMAWAVLEVVHGGLLTLAIRLTELAPERPSRHGRWIVLGVVLATFLGMMPAALDAGRSRSSDPPSLPTADRSLVVIGIDGVLPSEVGYLLGAGELPAMRAALDTGARLLPYKRQAGAAPSSFWTTVASGVPSPLHGMESLDSFRPAGMSRPLLRSGWLRAYWNALTPTGLVEYRPVLSSQRAVWTFWELAGRGSSDALSVNWWGTFPADAGSGATVAHGAYQILTEAAGDEGPDGAVEPASFRRDLQQKAISIQSSDTTAPSSLLLGLQRVLEAEDSDALLEKSLWPDAFYREVFDDLLELRPGTRHAALYLPGLDIAASLADPGSVAQSEMVRWQLRGVDRLLDTLPPSDRQRSWVILFDPGRRSAGEVPEGQVLIWHPEGCDSSTDGEELDSEELGALVLRLSGLPQSAEIVSPPAICRWPEPPLSVESYGPRDPAADSARGDEYLEQLKSLGYL